MAGYYEILGSGALTLQRFLNRDGCPRRIIQSMNTKFPLAMTAGLIADPSRAAMLITLLDGQPKSAGELAMAADVSAQSASMHLAQLLHGGFLQVKQEGRHRYYALSKPEVAHAIESLGAISTPQRFTPTGASKELCYARTCYDHLAGEVAIRIIEGMERNRLLTSTGTRDFDLTQRGEEFLKQLRIDVSALRKSRRRFAFRCLDWTERRDHLAGAVGAALCQQMLELHWITRDKRSRVVYVSAKGERELQQLLS